jgi:membrane-associated protease RseP (regulator of RpoE activity)
LSSVEPSERGDLPPVSYDSSAVQTAVAAPAPARDRVWLHLLLLLLTFGTTTLAGVLFYQNFATNVGLRPVRIPASSLLLNALWFSVTALTVLGAHEMGHYVACRYYGISASLPYFIPFLPGISPFGTLGAVIRIREPIRTKRMLFDIGVAGPIAGFVVLVPAILLGMSWSRLVHLPPHLPGGWEFGEPLLFKFAERLFFGGVPQGYDVNLHPMGWAAWLGMLATALNLLPVGQLDGGHIMYANFGKRANIVSYVTLGILLLIGVRGSINWLIWGGLLVLLMSLFGWQHPPTQDEDKPLDTNRILVSLFAIVMFVLCFTPVPMTPAP